MNPLILQFANGNAFFAGMLLLNVAIGVLLKWNTGLLRGLMTVIALTGIVFVASSATPFAIATYAVWGILAFFAVAITQSRDKGKKFRNLRLFGVLSAAAVSAALCVLELGYRKMPEVVATPGTVIYVIGDSISAGLDSNQRHWPEMMGEILGVDVVNLAQAGSTVRTALQQVKNVDETKSITILEIGGNDLLGTASGEDFESGLDHLLAQLNARTGTVVMLELPLPPFSNDFGRAQRAMARKHRTLLIPKTVLCSILGMTGGTTDGLHLSPTGQQALADLISKTIRVAGEE